MLARLNFLTSGELPASASQSAGITVMSHCTWPKVLGFIGVSHRAWPTNRFSYLKVVSGYISSCLVRWLTRSVALFSVPSGMGWRISFIHALDLSVQVTQALMHWAQVSSDLCLLHWLWFYLIFPSIFLMLLEFPCCFLSWHFKKFIGNLNYRICLSALHFLSCQFLEKFWSAFILF